MNHKQRIVSLLAASGLATFATACSDAAATKPSHAESASTSGDESDRAESTCGGGACGAVDTAADAEAER